MSCEDRKPCNNKSKYNSSSSSSNRSNNSSATGSKVGSNYGKKTEQILSSTVNSSVGSSATDLICDVSDIEKPNVKNQSQCPKRQDKEPKKVVPKSNALTFEEKAEINYATIIQNLCLSSLLTNRIKSEAEVCFSDFEAEKLKLYRVITTVNEWLKVMSSLQESEGRIEELRNTFLEVEGDIYQLQTLLKKVTLDIKMACGQVPLTELKVADASRGEFLSIIQELSNIRNEIISIMKPHEDSHMFAAENVDTCVSTALQLRSLIEDCSSSLPSVVSSYYRTLSIQLCLKRRGQDFQENKIALSCTLQGCQGTVSEGATRSSTAEPEQ